MAICNVITFVTFWNSLLCISFRSNFLKLFTYVIQNRLLKKKSCHHKFLFFSMEQSLRITAVDNGEKIKEEAKSFTLARRYTLYARFNSIKKQPGPENLLKSFLMIYKIV